MNTHITWVEETETKNKAEMTAEELEAAKKSSQDGGDEIKLL